MDQKTKEKVDVLELDKMYINFKKIKKKWIWLAVERTSQKIKGFYVGARNTTSFEMLSKRISHIDVTDAWDSYNLINPKNTSWVEPTLIPLNVQIVFYVITLLDLPEKLIPFLSLFI